MVYLNQERYRERNLVEKKCPKCGKPAAGFRLCPEHREQAARWERERRARRRQERLAAAQAAEVTPDETGRYAWYFCVKCGGRMEVTERLCPICGTDNPPPEPPAYDPTNCPATGTPCPAPQCRESGLCQLAADGFPTP